MKSYPVIKFTVLFIAGILSAYFFELTLLFIIILFLLTALIALFYGKNKESIFYPLITFGIAGILIFTIGNLLASENKISFNPFISDIDRVPNTTAVGSIKKIDLIRDNQLLFYVDVDSMYSEEFLVKDKFVVLCKARLESRAIAELYTELKPGYKVEVKGYYARGKQKRNPGEFDYDAYLRSKEILGIINVNDITSITILDYETNPVKNIIHQIRKSIDSKIKEHHSTETSALLRGLLLADRGDISYQTKTQFINAGVVHVLAVSGLHVGYIILIFLFLFGRFNLIVKSLLTVLGLLAFMLITGTPPSVFRATVMAVVLIIAYLSGRSTNLINSISIAALIILILNPNEIYNPGFQLSFAAVLSIGILLPYFRQLLDQWNVKNKFLRYLIMFCGVSISAQLGTLPFTLLYFNKYSLIALLTNLFVIPSIGFTIAAAIVALFFSYIIPSIAIYFAAANDLYSQFTLSVIKFSGDLSFSHINITSFSLFDLIIFYLMLTLLLTSFVRFTRVWSKIALMIFVIGNTILFSSLDDKKLLPDGFLSVLMIDVGQGDSFLIKFPNNKTALVDAGNTTFTFDNGERVIIPLLDYLGIKKIDYGIVTHIDSDHYGGFIALILDDRINEIFKPEIDSLLSKDLRFEEFIIERGIPINYFKEEKHQIGNTALYFLYDDEIKSLSGKSTNDRSGIFKLVYGETSFLFTGDVEKNIERFYSTKYGYFLDSDVLKVGHHGSKTSSSVEFLRYVSPELSLISAGFKNKFGHPVEEVIQRLEAEGSTIYRSDLNKAILLRSDGQEIKLINW